MDTEEDAWDGSRRPGNSEGKEYSSEEAMDDEWDNDDDDDDHGG